MIDINVIIESDALTGLKSLPDECVNCCITSPPYWQLRNYLMDGQIGLERTPEEYIGKLTEIFNEVRRVLKTNGTLWLNIGDSYAAAQKKRTSEQAARKSNLKGKSGQIACKDQASKIVSGLKAKDLIGVPWMLAFALRSSGWYLRQDIIWHKQNPMPESVTDRTTKSHEYIFLLSKSPKYYYDYKSIMTDSKNPEDDLRRLRQQKENKSMPNEYQNGLRPKSWNGSSFDTGKTGEMKHTYGGRKSGNIERKDRPGAPEDTGKHQQGSVPWEGMKANKRSVWTVNTQPFKEAHFATMPQELIIDCVKAGSKEDGIILDPFMGAGTTGLVARKLGRNFIGFELNPDYIKIANKRLKKELGMFL